MNAILLMAKSTKKRAQALRHSTKAHLFREIYAVTRSQWQQGVSATVDLADATTSSSLPSPSTSPVFPSEGYYNIGQRVLKDFGKHGFHFGTIIAYHPEDSTYKISYDNGDGEDLTKDEIDNIILFGDKPLAWYKPPGTTAPSGTATATDPLWSDNKLPNDTFVPDPSDEVQPGDLAATICKKECYKCLRGINGETCYVLITDRKSGSCVLSI
jgi:hypothetical protein